MAQTQDHSASRDASKQAVEADSEDALARYVMRLDLAREGHTAIQFHLSHITRNYRGRKHLRIAASMLWELIGPLPCPPFILHDGDIVLIAKGMDPEKLGEAIEMLRYLLSGEPLLPTAEGGDASLFTIYDLATEYPQLLASVRQISAPQAQAGTGRGVAAARHAAKTAPRPAQVGELIERLSKLELANMVRQQTVWTIPPGEEPRPLFDELYISVDGLREAIGLGREITNDPQFFQLVTRAFDKYMLATLLRDRSADKRAISINVNLQTLLSSDFVKFEHQRPLGWHGQIILEVQLANIWSDLPAFLSVVRAAKQNGFSCCIDGVTHHALPLIDFQRLEVDFIKVVWDDALLQLSEASLRDICRAFNVCGKERVILTRCGRQEALQFGHAANLRMFQGWYIDAIRRERIRTPRKPMARAAWTRSA